MIKEKEVSAQQKANVTSHYINPKWQGNVENLKRQNIVSQPQSWGVRKLFFPEYWLMLGPAKHIIITETNLGKHLCDYIQGGVKS